MLNFMWLISGNFDSLLFTKLKCVFFPFKNAGETLDDIMKTNQAGKKMKKYN